MYVKKCPYCGGLSYSAYGGGKWPCPYCGQSLERVPLGRAGGERHSSTDKMEDMLGQLKEGTSHWSKKGRPV